MLRQCSRAQQQSALQAETRGANYWDPTEMGYLRGLAEQGAPAIAAGVVVLVAFLVFFAVRCCCAVCGKVRRPAAPPRRTHQSCTAAAVQEPFRNRR